jgi:hypothetical protein
LSVFVLAFAQEKRNDRRPADLTPSPRAEKQPERPMDAAIHYTYEFNQPEFVVSHIVVQHDSTGRGEISFVQRTE